MIELIFGSKENNLNQVSLEVGNVLGLTFVSHESSYKGMYRMATVGTDKYEVTNNEVADYDDQPEENKEYYWEIETHKHCPILIWIVLLSENAKSTANDIKKKISNSGLDLEFIKQNEY